VKKGVAIPPRYFRRKKMCITASVGETLGRDCCLWKGLQSQSREEMLRSVTCTRLSVRLLLLRLPSSQ
jgi:hypothetical protein